MYYWLIPLIAGLLLLGVFLFFRVKEKRVTAVIIKGFVSLLFIVTAIVAWQTSNDPSNKFGMFVLIGLFFGLLGDILLDVKFILKDRELLFTILGFLAFLFGHFSYISGLFFTFFDFSRNIFYILLPAIVSVVLMVVTLLLEKFTAIKYQKMKPFVILYSIALFFCTTVYISTAFQTGWSITTLDIMAISLIFFALSDLILNNTYFASGFDGPGFIISNHVLYYLAQFAIAASLFFLM